MLVLWLSLAVIWALMFGVKPLDTNAEISEKAYFYFTLPYLSTRNGGKNVFCKLNRTRNFIE
jgi:hypothetical protein